MRYIIYSLALGLSLAAAACGSDGDDSSTDSAADAVPDGQMLAVTIESTTTEQALSTDPSTIDEAAVALADEINDAVALLQDRIDQLRSSATVTSRTVGALTCSSWTATTDAIAYRLSACERDRAVDSHTFVLEARAATSTSDADYVTLAAGHGSALTAYEGQRRGHGVSAYDFDSLHELRGAGPVGKLSIGYRAAGPVRQLAIAYMDFAFDDTSATHSARVTYKRVAGTGGKISFATYADVLAPGETAGTFVNGTDGLDEYARVSLGWTSSGGARVAAFACDGTVGEDTCVHWAQCYQATGNVSYEEIVSGTASISFSATECPSADVDDAPSESDQSVTVDTSADLDGAPAVAEPAAAAEE